MSGDGRGPPRLTCPGHRLAPLESRLGCDVDWRCPRTVPELLLLTALELSLERKQMPRVVENIENKCS
jgi:hypothetical protein